MQLAYWPFFDLRVRTERLELRLPRDEDLPELAALAAGGIHDPEEMPFAAPWTDAPPGVLERSVLQFHWGLRGALRPDDWNLSFAVWAGGRLAGTQTLLAKSFASLRTVATGSWLGRPFQRKGIGREMRGAVLALAFSGLGAVAATSKAFADNEASRRISLGLDYRLDGLETDAPREVARESRRFRIDRETWEARGRPAVAIEGLEACLPSLGAG